MHIDCTVHNPIKMDFDLKPSFAQGGPMLRFSTEHLRLTAHNADDEQILDAYATGLISRITLISKRDNGQPPFLTVKVSVPGVSIEYFWHPKGEIGNHQDALIEALAEVLVNGGEFSNMLGAINDIKRRARIAITAGIGSEEGAAVVDTTPTPRE